MPTCITIELYDKWSDDNKHALKGAMLEYFTECSAEAMGVELERRLAKVRQALAEAGEEHGWTAQTVAGLMIVQSAEDKDRGGLPTIKPCANIDRGCEYVWRLFLGPEGKQYDLGCFAEDYDHERGCMMSVWEVDWRRGKKI